MKDLTIKDLEYLAIGSAILGSGGGGNPENEMLMAKHSIHQYGPLRLVDPETLTREDLVLPVAVMGAPLVALEKLRSGREFLHLIEMVERTQGRRPTVLMPAEIGGANAFAPLSIAGQLDLPVLNADLMGRAFPQLQMTSCTVMGLSSSPAFLADSLGNTVRVEGKNAQTVENIARHITMSMGSSCAVAFCLMDGEQAKSVVIPHTLSQAIHIGQVIARAKEEGKDPIQAFLEDFQGVCLGRGTITAIEQSIKQGFLEGNVRFAGEEGSFELLYQNEYLFAKKEGRPVACTPDILMLLEKESGTPITADSLRFGLQVCLIALPAPAIWQSTKGLELTGPQCFGYSINYQPVGRK